jgi:hypothetical protein
MNFFTMESEQSAESGSTDCAVSLSRSKFLPVGIITANRYMDYPEPVTVGLQTVGRKWMDFLSPRNDYSPMLCSQRVLDSLIREGITGYRHVSTALYKSGKKIVPPWNYYWIIPTGQPYRRRVRLYTGSQMKGTYKFIHEAEDWMDKEQRPVTKSKVTGEHLYAKCIPVAESWDGSDFSKFTDSEPVNGRGMTYCSRRVLDLAVQEKWTNIVFSCVDAMDPFRIPHRKGPWPPVAWYSKFEPT